MTQQILAPHPCQYFAWVLKRRAASDSVDSLASTLVDAQVDLNPHQVDAARFACRNPLSRGVILADEVGLGKTALLREINQRNLAYFELEVQKLDAWADDLKLGLEQEVKAIDREI